MRDAEGTPPRTVGRRTGGSGAPFDPTVEGKGAGPFTIGFYPARARQGWIKALNRYGKGRTHPGRDTVVRQHLLDGMSGT